MSHISWTSIFNVPYCNSISYCIATFLDPRYKGTFLNSGMIARVKEALNNENPEEHETFIVSSNEELPAKRQLWDFLEDDETGASSSIREISEFERYSKDRKVPRTCDPPKYWENNKDYPSLRKHARKYLAIPSSSVRSERVFSISGNINSERRNKLRPELSEKLVVIHDNLKLV